MPRILVVDADAAARTWLGRVLEEHGYDIVAEASVWGLARTMALGLVDLVLLDHHLDDFDPLSVLRDVTASDHTTPVVMLTNDADQQMVVDYVRAGAADVVVKPLKPDYLALVVERTLACRSVTLRNMAYRALGYTRHKDDCLFHEDGQTCTCGLKEIFENIQDF